MRKSPLTVMPLLTRSPLDDRAASDPPEHRADRNLGRLHSPARRAHRAQLGDAATGQEDEHTLTFPVAFGPRQNQH